MDDTDELRETVSDGVPIETFPISEWVEHIKDYMGREGSDYVEIEKVAGVLQMMATLNWDERRFFLSALQSTYCRDCASVYLPCYCMRDD